MGFDPGKPFEIVGNAAQSSGGGFDPSRPFERLTAPPREAESNPAFSQELTEPAAWPAGPQTLPAAAGAAVGQGVVSGIGSAIAGAGRITDASVEHDTQRQIRTLDAIDQGWNVGQDQDPGGLRFFSPEARAKMRAEFTASAADQAKAGPNAVTRAGLAVEGAAPSLFPVDPANEGRVTSVGRMVGGAGPLISLSALGGPVGVLTSMAVVGSQAYDGAYQDAIAHGASHQEADDAGGKSAMTQAAAMSIPFGKVLQLVPVPLREGFVKTAINLGLRGVEMGGGNTLGTLAQNYVASETYDPTRPLFKGTGDAGIDGFLASLVIHAPAAAMVRPGPRAPVPTVGDIGKAPDINGAIEAAGKVAAAPAETAQTFGDLFASAPVRAADSGGGGTVLTTSSGMKVPYHYEVAEARDLQQASGDNQPRDRAGRVASAAQVVDLANPSKFDPELLHASPGPDQGAPSVDANGTILAGNGRVRVIRHVYATGGGDAYRAMAERYGFDTSGMDEPVLIRRLDQQMSPDQARQFAVDSNIPTVQRMSGTEQAAVDARSLTPDLLAQYNPLLADGPVAAGNRNFVRQWVGTLPQSERNAAMDQDGSISADGVRRLQGAMLSLAYGDKGTLSRQMESTDNNAKALTGALTDAAPAWAQLQSGIAEGRVPPEMNIAPQLTRAVELVQQAREKGISVSDTLAQSDAFNPVDPVTEGFLRAFHNPLLTRAASRPLVADVLRRYAVEAAKVSTAPDLFGDARPAVAPADILAAVLKAARSEPSALPEVPIEGQAAALGIRTAPAGGPGAGPAAPTQAAGAAVSTAHEAAMEAQDFLANRSQGETERVLAEPAIGDKNVYIPGTEQSLAELTGDPVVAMEHQYNRQQPAAAGFHTAREDKNGGLVTAYYADTAESKQQVLRMERDRDTLAQRNIQRVFGDPNSTRPPADPSPTLDLMREMMTNPGQVDRDSVQKTLSTLARKFSDADGNLTTDPLRLYGIGKHINDLLDGVGDTEASSAARVLKRELTLIKNSLYNDIEGAAPGFAKYRADYERDSRAISALKYLQDERMGLTNNLTQHITPSKWMSFMKGVVDGRADPMDPASSLSEDQMDRLWNITDHLKRTTLNDKGKPRGSWTSLLHEIGLRSIARVGGHLAAAVTAPVVGNYAVELMNSKLRERDVLKEMNRHLHPDLGQGPLPH
jgi:hypothetical protein